MAINPIADSLTAAQRIHYTQTPDTAFFDAFKAAYAQFAGTAAPQANPADTTATSVSDSSLALVLGSAHMDTASRRGIAAHDEVAFAGILNRAYSTGGMDDPVTFLKSLSDDDLRVLGRVHGLAASIDPGALSKEGAYNLLLPGGYSVDLDNNGMEDIGAGRKMHFPPRDAPARFVDAWTSATAGLDEGDLLTYSMIMHHQINGVSIGDGPPTGGIPSDKVESYRFAVVAHLDMLERMRYQLPEGQYEKSKPFFTNLLALLG